MRFFGVCQIAAAVTLFYAEIRMGGAYIVPGKNESYAVASARFLESQAVLLFGYLLPWVLVTLGISLLLERCCKTGRSTGR